MQVPMDSANSLGSGSTELRDRFSALMDEAVASGDLLAPLELRAFVDMSIDRLYKLRAGRNALIIRHLGHISNMALNAALGALHEITEVRNG